MHTAQANKMASSAEGADLPLPPGFEDYSADGDEAALDMSELEAFRAFMSEPLDATSQGREDSLKQDNKKGSGLIGEQGAVVEVTPYRQDGLVADEEIVDEASQLLDMAASFEDMGFHQDLLRGIYEMGFVKPSKIQAAALPLIGKARDNMIGQAQNGSGKTATFSLALLSQLDIDVMQPQALVICPTRELAKQNERVIANLGQFLPVRTCCVVPSQERIPRNPEVHVLVGTPGKIQDLTKKRVIDLSSVKVFVLDEADVMLDQDNQMGPQVTQIRKWAPNDLQVLFFSATYPDDVRQFAEHLVPKAWSIKVKKTELTVSSVQQVCMRCGDENDKFEKLSGLYGALNVGQSIIFVNARRKAFELANKMRNVGHAVSLICGTQDTPDERMDPALRDKVMDEFRSGVTRVLIATDVLSRGIDVPQVTLVVNYELPINFGNRGASMETYLHRVGRTGRFGLRGIAVNLVGNNERTMVDEICSYFACAIPEMDNDYEALEEKLRILR